jgi:hypothetical protein
VTSSYSGHESAPASAAETVASQPAEPSLSSGRSGWRWWLLAVGLLLVWIALGLLAPLDAVGFLALGALLTAGFQLGRRTPPRQLLARDGTSLTRTRTAKVTLVAALLSVPAFLMVRYVPT